MSWIKSVFSSNSESSTKETYRQDKYEGSDNSKGQHDHEHTWSVTTRDDNNNWHHKEGWTGADRGDKK